MKRWQLKWLISTEMASKKLLMIGVSGVNYRPGWRYRPQQQPRVHVSSNNPDFTILEKLSAFANSPKFAFLATCPSSWFQIFFKSTWVHVSSNRPQFTISEFHKKISLSLYSAFCPDHFSSIRYHSTEEHPNLSNHSTEEHPFITVKPPFCIPILVLHLTNSYIYINLFKPLYS